MQILGIPVTPISILNFCVLQWLGIRLGRKHMKDSNGEPTSFLSWGILGGCLPLTGWWTDYIGFPYEPQWLDIKEEWEFPICIYLAMASGAVTALLIKMWLRWP